LVALAILVTAFVALYPYLAGMDISTLLSCERMTSSHELGKIILPV
jgi:hypothetical protein